MALRRRAVLVLCLAGVAPLAAGCRAFTNSPAAGALTKPAPLATRPSATAEQIAAQINSNARNIQSIKAVSTIRAAGRWRAGGAEGRIALEKPRNFRLMVRATGHPDFADIGSNDREFWYASGDEKAMYVGQYDADGRVPASVPLHMQPDWLVEAMGLRELTPEEIAAITVKPGPKGLLSLSYPRRSATGEVIKKIMFVDPNTKLVAGHQLWTADNKLLARADVQEYRRYQAPRAEGGDDTVTVTLPARVDVTWFQPEQISLTAVLDPDTVQVNLPRTELAADFFAMPDKPGYARMAFSPPDGGAYASAPTTIRETRPAPSTSDEGTVPAGNGNGDGSNPVHLDGLVPLGDQGAQRTSGPAPLTPDLPELPIRAEAIAGAAMPQPPGEEPAPAVPQVSRRPLPSERY